ncbi:MAG: anthranilate phosphoribosyltransferase [Magnetococcales bacterium]|nr:anthranilate phosphoribosyltransferase [Magnetococcales bacterium]
MKIQQAIEILIDGSDLTQVDARRIMDQILSGENSDAEIDAYISALHNKGESISEIAGSAMAVRKSSITLKADGVVVDTSGTGSKGLGTFNISTTSAFVVAGGGVKVAKHGNHTVSDKTGSAELLKALGVNINAGIDIVERCIAQAGIGFLFSPIYHETMNAVIQKNKNLAKNTLFNLLGPLTNPVNTPYQIIGVYDGIYTESVASALGRLGSKHAMVVHGMDGLDEITTTAATRVAELKEDGHVTAYIIEPEQFGINRAKPEAILGGDVAANVEFTQGVLAGEKGPHRDIVALNAGAAFCVSGVADSIESGLKMAFEIIDSGKAREKLELLVKTSNS